MRSLRDLFGFVLAPLGLALAATALDLPQSLSVAPYEDGVTPLYIDRPYRNLASNAALAGLRVVRVPRHLRFDVELELGAPARVIRLLASDDDDAALAGWQRADELRVNVPGRSCTLTRAVARELAAGSHRLPPGGPAAAAPLLIASEGEVTARTTRSWNKLAAAEDPLTFARRNARKLGALGLAWAAWCLLLWRLRRPRDPNASPRG
jgi:hypothetical protein